MIGVILKLAGYTYGPLLGLFAFGMLTRRTPDATAWCRWSRSARRSCARSLSSIRTYLFGSYRLGLELLIVNGILVFAGLFAISRSARQDRSPAVVTA